MARDGQPISDIWQNSSHGAERELGAKPERLTVWVRPTVWQMMRPTIVELSAWKATDDAVQVMTIHKSKGWDYPLFGAPICFTVKIEQKATH